MTIIKMTFSPVQGGGLRIHKSLSYHETPKTYQDVAFDNDRCLAVLHKSNLMVPDSIMREAGWGTIYCLESDAEAARELLLDYVRSRIQREVATVENRAFIAQKLFDEMDENFPIKFANSTWNNHSTVHLSGRS
uniref:DNA-binding protein n=1 Tax=Serratia phage Kevin TaxID=3161161 RepID=A0AAU8L043_9CAUD